MFNEFEPKYPGGEEAQEELIKALAENPFLDLDVYFLEALLTGEAEIVGDEK
jgi:hypothetical protein